MADETETPAKKKLNIPYGKIAFEFLSVLFAVTLALTGNEWRQRRSDQAMVRRVMITMKGELTANKKQLESVYPYHANLVKELEQGTHRVGHFHYPTETTKDLKTLRAFLGSLARETGLMLRDDDVLERRKDGGFWLSLNGRLLRLEAAQDTLSIFGDGNIQLRSPSISNTSWEIAQATQAIAHMDYSIIEPFSALYQEQKEYSQSVQFALQILYTGEGSITSTLQDMVYYEGRILKRYDELLLLLEEKLEE
ncbi:MAG: hypothetical protein HC859_05560 [Bacteroidia bacterium]|nr:hypothetical protein [Bacteroidia bacterium]